MHMRSPRRSPETRSTSPHRYIPPENVSAVTLRQLLQGRRSIQEAQQRRLDTANEREGPRLWCAGDLQLAQYCAVAIVGTREVSQAGAARARRLARELVAHDIVVVSGLARGVDTAALTAAIEAGGRVIAVIGTPLEQVSPVANARLQEDIGRHHLLVSQFASGASVHKGNFPERNKLMAALSDATVIIEAGDTSGTLHQAAECVRLGRRLFITRSTMEDASLQWPRRFEPYPNVTTMSSVEDVLDGLAECR
jgi:DNA processing protein